MTVLVEQDAEKQRHHDKHRNQRVYEAAGVVVAQVGEEDQYQQEGPVDLYIYIESPAYFYRTSHL